MTSVGKFLIGGIQFRKNFCGATTIQTSIYTVAEVAIKVTPIFLIVGHTCKSYQINNYSRP